MEKSTKNINSRLEKWLKDNEVRPTAVRLMLAGLLFKADKPLSALDIEITLDTVDRSTITRTLGLFGNHGLIHIIDDQSGVPKYEWCRNPRHHEPWDNHPHFHCIKCRRTICLCKMLIPATRLPANYQVRDISFIISGLCPECSGRE